MTEQKDYRFILIRNSVETEVPEPIGWDAVSFTLRRSDFYSGLEFSFTDSLQFDREGRDILKAAYEESGFDAVVAIRIEDCDEGAIYEGVINFSLYKEVNSCPDDCAEAVTVGIQQSGLTQKFKNRIDTPINLFRTIGMDGGPLSPVPVIDLQLHSKEIVFQSSYKINEFLKEFDHTEGKKNGLVVWDIAHVPPFQAQTQEVGETLEPYAYWPMIENPYLYSGFQYPAGISSRQVRVDGRLKFTAAVSYSTGDPQYSLYLRLLVRGVQSGITTQEIIINNIPLPNSPLPNLATTVFDATFSHTLSLPPDSNIFLEIRATDNNFVRFFVTYDTAASYLTFNEQS